MLYFVLVNQAGITNSGQAGAKKVAVMSVTQLDGQDYYANLRHFLYDKQNLTELSRMGDRIRVEAFVAESDSPRSLAYPVVSEGTPNGAMDLSRLYSFLLARGPEFSEYQKASEALKGQFSADFLKNFHEAQLELVKYQKGEAKHRILVPELYYDNVAVTKSIIEEYNSKLGHQFQYINTGINRTNFMASETDEFFIQIPSYERLQSVAVEVKALIPSRNEIAQPYPHPIYQTPFADRVYRESPSALMRTLTEIRHAIKTPDQLRNVPKIPQTHVFGSTANNDLDILENELNYFNALDEMVRYDIAQTFPGRDVDELYAASICSKRMTVYLDGLLDLAISMNWGHTGKFPVGFDDDEDDDPDSDRDSSPSEEAERALYISATDDFENAVFDGQLILEEFISHAAESGLGLRAKIEAIIKLFRWGAVKPNVLKIDGYKRYLDMNNLVVRNTTGNMDSQESETFDGYEMRIIGMVIFDDKFKDPEFCRRIGLGSVPSNIAVGFQCEKRYKGGISQTVYMTFLEAVLEFRKNPESKLLQGIVMRDGKFVSTLSEDISQNTVTLRIANDRVASDVDKLFIHHISDAIRRLKLEFSSPKITDMGVLYRYLTAKDSISQFNGALRFNTKEELFQKVAETSLSGETIVEFNVAEVILPIVLKSWVRYESEGGNPFVSVAQILNIYSETMKDTGFSAEDDFLRPVQTEQVEPQTQQVSNSNHFGGAQTMTAQATVQQSEPTQIPPQSAGSAPSISLDPSEMGLDDSNVAEYLKSKWVSPIGPAEETYIISDTDGTPIGAFTQRVIEGKTISILADTSVIRPNSQPSTASLNSMLMLVCNAMYGALMGKAGRAQLRFHSVETLRYYTRLVQAKAQADAQQKQSEIQASHGGQRA